MRHALLAALLPLAMTASACGGVLVPATDPPPARSDSGGPASDEPPECHDGLMDGQETDVDCGGPVCSARCDYQWHCVFDADCLTGDRCAGGFCGAPFCLDHVKDGDESDVDCGGADPGCRRCSLGDACLAPSDCSTGGCHDGLCSPPATCYDGVTDGDETDVDCGGACQPCRVIEANCADGRDCESGVCIDGFCRAPTCEDYVQNGDETGIDCGGPTCPPCSGPPPCLDTRDCAFGVCVKGICRDPTCNDGVQDGDETGVDCGGATCPPCSP